MIWTPIAPTDGGHWHLLTPLVQRKRFLVHHCSPNSGVTPDILWFETHHHVIEIASTIPKEWSFSLKKIKTTCICLSFQPGLKWYIQGDMFWENLCRHTFKKYTTSLLCGDHFSTSLVVFQMMASPPPPGLWWEALERKAFLRATGHAERLPSREERISVQEGGGSHTLPSPHSWASGKMA